MPEWLAGILRALVVALVMATLGLAARTYIEVRLLRRDFQWMHGDVRPLREARDG